MKKIISMLTALLLLFSMAVISNAEYENDYINSGDVLTDILEVAATQIGYSPKEAEKSKYDNAASGSYANSSAEFIAWCANEASASEDSVPRLADVKKLFEFYENNGRITSFDEHLPSEGDIIFLTADNEIELCGIVVTSDEEYITVIICDKDSEVKKKMYSVSLSKIFAYATPDYSIEAKLTPGEYMTTASTLNFRKQSTTSSQIIGKIPLGTIVTVTSISGEWGRITYNGSEGWINMQYAVPYDDSHTDTSKYGVNWNVIDVSKWQGDINWDKIGAADIDAVIIRIGGRGTATKEIYDDEKFFEYYEGAQNAGLHIGCYFYSAATSVEAAEEEARYVVDMIREHDLKFDMPVYIDMEDKVVERTGKTMIFNMTKTFMDVMTEENIYSGVYCSTSWATDYYTPALFSNNALWIADWNDKCGYNGDYGMWQYTEYGSVSGIAANYTDLNICYINYPELIEDLKFNTPPEEPDILKGDINGDGKVTAADARTALRAASGLEQLSSQEIKSADLTDDGKITAADARLILRISAGLQ